MISKLGSWNKFDKKANIINTILVIAQISVNKLLIVRLCNLIKSIQEVFQIIWLQKHKIN